MCDDGVQGIVYRIAGSPLSGTNCCAAVRADGVCEKACVKSFPDSFRPFIGINCRYSEAKARYQAYTLQQVL